MGTNRRVDATGHTTDFQHFAVQGLAHAVQTLEFVIVHAFGFGHLQNGGDGMGVMSGELRVYAVRHVQQFGGAGEERDITAGLTGEHRKTIQAHHLGTLDFGIPVSALDQAHHDLAVVRLGQPIDPVNHEGRALAVSLNHNAKAIPSGQFGV